MRESVRSQPSHQRTVAPPPARFSHLPPRPQLGEMWGGGGGGKEADVQYVRVKAMLTSLGLQQFEKNVRKGQLTDATIGLWDTAALQVGGGKLACLSRCTEAEDAAGRRRAGGLVAGQPRSAVCPPAARLCQLSAPTAAPLPLLAPMAGGQDPAWAPAVDPGAH